MRVEFIIYLFLTQFVDESLISGMLKFVWWFSLGMNPASVLLLFDEDKYTEYLDVVVLVFNDLGLRHI